MLVVWDSVSGTPIRTYLNPHPNGVKTIDISADNSYLATLGNDEPQTISLWDWTNEKRRGTYRVSSIQVHLRVPKPALGQVQSWQSTGNRIKR